MAKASSSKAEAEAILDSDQRLVFAELISDYGEAAKIYTTYRGGPSPKIIAELVRRGWRKIRTPANPN